MREITQTECEKTGERLDAPRVLGWVQPASQKVAQMVIDAEAGTDDGRSEWLWLRLANGDLLLATFPRGDTYLSTEADTQRP